MSVFESVSQERLLMFLRFCVVGGTSAFMDLGSFYLAKLVMPYQVAIILGYSISFVYNYFLNVYWTFGQKPNTGNAVGIALCHIINLFVIRMGLMWLFVSVILMSENVAYIPTLIISVVANFLMVNFVINKTTK